MATIGAIALQNGALKSPNSGVVPPSGHKRLTEKLPEAPPEPTLKSVTPPSTELPLRDEA
jgi:hypothetical protein